MNCTTNCGCSTAEAQTKTAQTTTTFRPEVDIYETGDEYVVVADVPGARAETIDLHVENGTLTLKAGVAQREPVGAKPIGCEYGVGSYERAFRIGEDIDAENISADLKDGVLTLRLPKPKASRARRIQVQSN